VEVCPSPADRAFQAQLGEQLARVPGGGAAGRSPLAVLAGEVATALVEASFTLHDCDGLVADKALGGVCLTPSPASGGVIVSWTQHERMAVAQVRGEQVHTELQAVMNDALFQALQTMGLAAQPFGEHDLALVAAVVVADVDVVGRQSAAVVSRTHLSVGVEL